MLINRLKQGIRLIGATAATIDQEGVSKEAIGYATWWGERGSTRQLPDVPAWVSPSLVLATARTTSGM